MMVRSNGLISPRTIFTSLLLTFTCLFFLLISGCRNEVDQALGTLEWDRVNSRAPASEVILEVYAREGNFLNSGDPILLLDNQKILQQLAESRARLEQASWRLRELEKGPRPQALAEAEARLTAARAHLTTAGSTLKRQQQLFVAKNTSVQHLEESRSRYLEAVEKVRELEAQLSELREGTRMEQLNQARAEVTALTAMNRRLQLLEQEYTIRAARGGLLESLPFKKGDKPPAQAVVSTILAGETPWARVYIPQPYRAVMEPGAEFLLQMDGQPESFPVRLRTISSKASFTPFFSLTERDRSRLSYVAEFDLLDTKGRQLTAGIPVQLILEKR